MNIDTRMEPPAQPVPAGLWLGNTETRTASAPPDEATLKLVKRTRRLAGVLLLIHAWGTIVGGEGVFGIVAILLSFLAYRSTKKPNVKHLLWWRLCNTCLAGVSIFFLAVYGVISFAAVSCACNSGCVSNVFELYVEQSQLMANATSSYTDEHDAPPSWRSLLNDRHDASPSAHAAALGPDGEPGAPPAWYEKVTGLIRSASTEERRAWLASHLDLHAERQAKHRHDHGHGSPHGSWHHRGEPGNATSSWLERHRGERGNSTWWLGRRHHPNDVAADSGEGRGHHHSHLRSASSSEGPGSHGSWKKRWHSHHGDAGGATLPPFAATPAPPAVPTAPPSKWGGRGLMALEGQQPSSAGGRPGPWGVATATSSLPSSPKDGGGDGGRGYGDREQAMQHGRSGGEPDGPDALLMEWMNASPDANTTLAMFQDTAEHICVSGGAFILLPCLLLALGATLHIAAARAAGRLAKSPWFVEQYQIRKNLRHGMYRAAAPVPPYDTSAAGAAAPTSTAPPPPVAGALYTFVAGRGFVQVQEHQAQQPGPSQGQYHHGGVAAPLRSAAAYFSGLLQPRRGYSAVPSDSTEVDVASAPSIVPMHGSPMVFVSAQPSIAPAGGAAAGSAASYAVPQAQVMMPPASAPQGSAGAQGGRLYPYL